MDKIFEVEQDSDMPVLKVQMPGINGEILNPKGDASYELEFYTSKVRSAGIKYDANFKELLSIGEIPMNYEIDGNIIKCYIKSSKVPFGRGQLKAKMVLYINNENYEDGIQVLRTKEKLINIKVI